MALSLKTYIFSIEIIHSTLEKIPKFSIPLVVVQLKIFFKKFSFLICEDHMSLLQQAIQHSSFAFRNHDSFLRFLPGKSNIIVSDGLNFRLHIPNPTLKHKNTNPLKISSRDPLMPPYEPYIQLGHDSQHYLILNRYQFLPGHIIMALDNQNEKQGSLLKSHDFKVLSTVFQNADDKGLAYYNGGIDAGCTQLHKHLQYVPSLDNPLFDLMAKGGKLPFRYFYEKLEDYDATTIGDSYKRLIEKMNNNGSYNFLVSNKTAILVPRLKARTNDGLLIGSLSICGHLFANPNKPNSIHNPIDILKEVCIPN